MSFLWIPGLINFSEHDAFDFATKNFFLLHKISESVVHSPLFLALKMIVIPEYFDSWYDFWKNQYSNTLGVIESNYFELLPIQVTAIKKSFYSVSESVSHVLPILISFRVNSLLPRLLVNTSNMIIYLIVIFSRSRS